MSVKRAAKDAIAVFLLRLIRGVQRLTALPGKNGFVQGQVFDALLEHTTRTATGKGESIIFHTPNPRSRSRALTLLTKEPDTLQWIETFEPGSIFWDIGANVGTYSIYAALRIPRLKVYAFEPSIENTYLLNRNISSNGLEQRILAFPLPLSDHRGPELFKHAKLELGGALSSFGVDYTYDGSKPEYTTRYRLYGFRPDDLKEIFAIEDPRYIKLDVDGIEHLILRGASRVLSNPTLASVLVELNRCVPDQHDDIVQLLAAHDLVPEPSLSAATPAIYNQIFVRRTAV